jgi:hypothetical protein
VKGGEDMKKVLIALTMLGVAAFAPVAQAHDHHHNWNGYDGWHGDYEWHHPYYHHHHSHVFIGFGFEPPVYYSPAPSYYDQQCY